MLKPIHTPSDYKAALAEVSVLIDLDPPKGSKEGDRLEILATLVESHERGLVNMSLPAAGRDLPIKAPPPGSFVEFSLVLEAALAVHVNMQKGKAGKTAFAAIKQMYELNEKAAPAGIVAQKRAMARLVENVQLQVDRAKGQRRFKTRQSVRRPSKRLVNPAPIQFKQAV